MAHLAKEIALANNLDGRKAYVAGMLHDIAKEMPHDEAVVIMQKIIQIILINQRRFGINGYLNMLQKMSI